MKRLALLAALAFALPAFAQDAPVTPASIVAAAPAADWKAINPADLLVMDLARDRDDNPRRVVIQLIPAPFSEGWVGNIRKLAAAHWWDGTSVYRVVDNWVAQWGDGEDDAANAKPLPTGMVSPSEPYVITEEAVPQAGYEVSSFRICHAPEAYCEKYYAQAPDDPFEGLNEALVGDPYSPQTYFRLGWPLAEDLGRRSAWPTHCYATVGVARDVAPDTGTGAELYAVIGHGPRQLDRNIAVVGRVIEGIEHLSTLPRGKGDAGVYDDPESRVAITSVRLGNELPQTDQPKFEYLASDSTSFARYVWVRANRHDDFYEAPAQGIDICNVQVPIRRVASKP